MNMKPGFGPKDLFFHSIEKHFEKPANLKRLLTVFTGAACEQWINAECFMALREDRPDAWIRSEWKKRDLALFEYENAESPELIIETKVLYTNYPESKQRSFLLGLASQLEGSRELVDEDAPKNAVVGLVVSFDWTTYVGGEYLPPQKTKANHEDLPRSLLGHCGLENAFGHTGGRLFSGRVQRSGGHHEVAVRFEMVRLTE